MVNPGAFIGLRKAFLMGEKPAYAMAVGSDYVADAVANITRRYLKRFPIDLPHDEEPSEEFLKSVDDNAPDVEPEEPNRDLLSEEEYKVAVENLQARRKLLDFRKAQIKRWFAYQYTKDNDVHSNENGARAPYTALMKMLTGSNSVKPRMKTAANVWRKAERDRIERALKTEILEQQRLGNTIPVSQYAMTRDRIARHLYSKLDEGAKHMWLKQAMAEHSAALKAYEQEINSNPSTDPADRQRAIQGLTKFMQPILDMGCAVTGWKMSLIAGGPEPALGGQLSSLSIHSGYTCGDIKMTFGRAERARYKKHVIPIFGSFLQQCYSPDECRSRALPAEEGFMPMSSYEPETDEVAFINIDASHPPTTTTSNNTEMVTPTVARARDESTRAVRSYSSRTPVNAGVPGLIRAKPAEPSRETTQDSRPVDANPFLFEEGTEDDQSTQISPPPSAPPSPPLSRKTSPAPTQHLEESTRPSGSNQETNIDLIAHAAHVSSNRSPATAPPKRKRGVLEDVVLAEGSKRTRMQTTRARVAEELNLIGRKKKVATEAPASPAVAKGKENRKPVGKGVPPKGAKAKSSKRR